ncbi:hypothetical protein LPJ70_003991 [Coemansia sp. RSA 2708]|nr:hypothetical protein LPJ70_003991 [Coemansia sp. RSA 2708]
MAALADINADDLQNLKRKQLQSLCKKHGIKANGKNEELIEQLLEHAQNGTPGDGADDSQTETDSEGDDEQFHEASGEASEPEKVFKVMPTTDTKPLEMEAPESMKQVGNSDFSSMVEKVSAQLEARVAAMTAEQRQQTIDQYKASSNVAVTPNTSKQAKSISFDKAHDKIFNNDDSIASHWAANKVATPRTKRTNEDKTATASNKRQRIEPLFSSPAVTKMSMQSPSQRRKSTKAKAMTARARRTAAATANTGTADGAKTVATSTRTKSSAALSSTKLFADAHTSLSAVDSIADSVPIAEPETASDDLVAAHKPKESNALTDAPAAPEMSEKAASVEVAVATEPVAAMTADGLQTQAQPAISAEPVEAAEAEKSTNVALQAEPAPLSQENPANESKASVSKLKPPSDTAAKKFEARLGKLAPSSSNITAPVAGKSASTKPTTTAMPLAPARPTLIPTSRKNLQSKAATQSTSSLAESKSAATNKAAGIPRPTTSSDKPNVAKPPPTHKPADYSNVQSKLKAYINAKPQTASKPKPADSSAPSAIAKPNATANKQPAVSALPKPAVGRKKAEGNGSVPGYMRSTKATEIRAHKQQPLTEPGKTALAGKSQPGGPVAAAGGNASKARFNPYSRPARPVASKPSTAK